MMLSVMFSVDIADILTIDSWDSMDKKNGCYQEPIGHFHIFSNKQWGSNQVSWGHSKGCMGYVTSLTQHNFWICLETIGNGACWHIPKKNTSKNNDKPQDSGVSIPDGGLPMGNSEWMGVPLNHVRLPEGKFSYMLWDIYACYICIVYEYIYICIVYIHV